MQIHKEAEREKTQNQLLNDLTPMRNRDGNQGGPQGGMRGGPNDRKTSGRGQTSEDGWTSVQPKVSQRSSVYDRIDTSKIANLAQNSARRVSFSDYKSLTWIFRL